MVAFDVAVPRSRFGEFLDQAVQLVGKTMPEAVVYDFGHVGDGGVHLNVVVPPATSSQAIVALRDSVYELTVNVFGGSFSAEHGIGPYNQRWYAKYTEPAMLELAAALHHHFDPSHCVGNVRLDN
ncbi:MAG: FAD-linked oxidase C-terminal domain-containing protein [Elusimicrobiota bacterium]|nr:FAD-linked oxidase C-terminal domain-containing protein [Elusimicrobiota bacterium]